MDDTRSGAGQGALDNQHRQTEHTDPAHADQRSAWERALDGPPINPRSELIYHDRHRR